MVEIGEGFSRGVLGGGTEVGVMVGGVGVMVGSVGVVEAAARRGEEVREPESLAGVVVVVAVLTNGFIC